MASRSVSTNLTEMSYFFENTVETVGWYHTYAHFSRLTFELGVRLEIQINKTLLRDTATAGPLTPQRGYDIIACARDVANSHGLGGDMATGRCDAGHTAF
jgi:hypothetical protein